MERLRCFQVSLLLLVWIIFCFCHSPATGQPQEVCTFEQFNATCNPDQVVLMTEAWYGRMKKGRCVTTGFGHMGCKANVLKIVDKFCSGKTICQFAVHLLDDLSKPCPMDLKCYLEADYQCIDVLKYKYSDCNRSITLTKNSPMRYISTEPDPKLDVFKLTNAKCPIVVQALPGQYLNFTVFKFGDHVTGSSADHVRNRCPLRVSFSEHTGTSKDVSQCDIQLREQLVYSSSTDKAVVYIHPLESRVHIPNAAVDETHTRVLLKVEAVGCQDLQAPPHAWVERRGDKAIVKCNHTQETWYVTCTDNTWTGHVTNCTAATSEKTGGGGGSQTAARKGHIPLGLVVAVTIGVILGVMFGIGMLISVFVYRHRRRAHKNSSKTLGLLNGPLNDEALQDNDENYARRVWIEHKHDDPYGRICRGHNVPLQYSSASSTDYSHMFELQCSARAHAESHTLASSSSGHYGVCGSRRSPGTPARMDDLHSCTLPLTGASSSSSAKSPSFATFRAERAGPGRSSPGHPHGGASSSSGHRAAPPNAGSGNKNRSLSSVAELDDVTSPDHQPDLVTSSNTERGLVTGNYQERPLVPAGNAERALVTASNTERAIVTGGNQDRILVTGNNVDRALPGNLFNAEIAE